MDKIQIEVAYASTTEHQTLLTLRVDSTCTVEKAILLSGILDIYPEIDLSNQVVGI
ncbi:MAG TPA: RnfH family protein, partial [Gammaproteobacteria bacterium]|nr:RnfH family protein [Gammaproteobacteria bacterium]